MIRDLAALHPGHGFQVRRHLQRQGVRPPASRDAIRPAPGALPARRPAAPRFPVRRPPALEAQVRELPPLPPGPGDRPGRAGRGHPRGRDPAALLPIHPDGRRIAHRAHPLSQPGGHPLAPGRRHRRGHAPRPRPAAGRRRGDGPVGPRRRRPSLRERRGHGAVGGAFRAGPEAEPFGRALGPRPQEALLALQEEQGLGEGRRPLEGPFPPGPARRVPGAGHVLRAQGKEIRRGRSGRRRRAWRCPWASPARTNRTSGSAWTGSGGRCRGPTPVRPARGKVESDGPPGVRPGRSGPLERREVPTPEPGPGEILVRVLVLRRLPHRSPYGRRRASGREPAAHPRP